MALVARLMAEAGNFEGIITLDRSPRGWGDPLFAVVGQASAKAR